MTSKVQSDTKSSPAPPSYLVLQGLGSPFFKALGANLGADGSPVHKINFCGGDWWFSGHSKNHRFNGKLETLDNYCRDLIKQHGITTVILFGDCRPIHKIARSVANDLGLTIWVFEEGYIRPGFITCERGGTNDLSALPRAAAQVTARAAEITEDANTAKPWQAANPMPARVRMDLAHHLWNILLKPFYYRYRTHRPDSMMAEIKGWLARIRRKMPHRYINAALTKRYENTDKPFFMVPLQLNSDFQIREHSDYDGVLDFVRETVASFARNAPKGTLLMFKSHPLDNGMIDYRSYIAMAAMKHNIEGRVDYLEGGDLDEYLNRALGIILINSTVGYAALAKAKPLKVMGRALYNMTGLADQRSLDKFWKKPPAPDPELVNNFLKVIRTDSQIRGDLFTKAGIEMASAAAAARIKAHTGSLAPQGIGTGHAPELEEQRA